ncbi:uncharacterized protein TNCV_3847691 [Trichonephila clavipes]|nr:uncharacterized protein TNCV_3847691 [Trichonephila clavipes]
MMAYYFLSIYFQILYDVADICRSTTKLQESPGRVQQEMDSWNTLIDVATVVHGGAFAEMLMICLCHRGIPTKCGKKLCAWTDESRFPLFTNDGRQRIRREQHEALHPDCVQPYLPPGWSRISPRGALEFDGDRNDQMAVSRLLNGHLKCMAFESGRKVFHTCSKCHLLPASPEHILDCLGLALEDVHASPFLVLDFARVNGLMDLI